MREGEKKNIVFLGSTYVFIIRVILSPLRRILPVKHKKKYFRACTNNWRKRITKFNYPKTFCSFS
jgi:hypothetical protein